MINNTINESLLFTNCANLNTENYPFRTEPETLLTLIRDPENFLLIKEKVQDYNDTCSGCSSFKKKTKGY